VRFSPEIYQIDSIKPVSAGQFGCPLYLLKDSQGRITRYKSNSRRPPSSGELLKVGTDTPVGHVIDLTRASYLSKSRGGEDLYYEPEVRQVRLAPVPVQRPPVPVSQYRSKEWTDALKNKLFTDYDGVRSRIIKVVYSRVYRSYTVDYGHVESAVQTYQEELKLVLELSQNEDWFVPAYREYTS